MIDMTKQYTYQGKQVRIYSDGSDTYNGFIHLAIQNEDGTWYEPSKIIYESDLVEVWKPTEGEICYVWNEGAMLPNIRKYINTSANGMFLCVSRDGSKVHDSNGYKYCATFTGELPKAFKGL